MALPQEYLVIRDRARLLAAQCASFAAEADRCSTVHLPTQRALQESGLARFMVPRQYGGETEQVDPLAVCVIREVLMGTSAHLDQLFGMQGIGSYAVSTDGTGEQRSRWLPSIASVDILPALALTEPDTGSDLKKISTRLTQIGDELVVDGYKAFISNAGAATFFTVLAREDAGYSLVLIPRDVAGVTVHALPELIAPHIIGDVSFDQVRLPASARLGEPTQGFGIVLRTLAVFRASVAGAAVGLAEAALRIAVDHAKERHQFGGPLARIGAVQQMLAESWSELEMIRLITYRAAMLARDNEPEKALVHSSMAKLQATELAGKIVDRGVQIMGRFGLIQDAEIERLYRAARPMRIYEGSSEVLRGSIARALCDP